MTVDVYNEDWNKYRRYIELKIKGKCEINNKNWLKLRDYHFENWIKTVPYPYGLIFKMIYLYKMQKNIPCIYKVYYRYRNEMQKELDGVFRNKSKAQAFKRYR